MAREHLAGVPGELVALGQGRRVRGVGGQATERRELGVGDEAQQPDRVPLRREPVVPAVGSWCCGSLIGSG